MRVVPLLLLVLSALLSCSRIDRTRDQLIVFAAASLSTAMSELGTRFESSHPNAQVSFNFAGSQQLRAQVDQGAHADVFASADTTEMQALVAAGHVKPDQPRLFAHNRLVIVAPPSNPAQVTRLSDLARPALSLALADASVPAGRYARHVLQLANNELGPSFSQQVLANVVSYETSVKAVVSKVRLGEVDAGIVYVSDITASPADSLVMIEVPDAFGVQASYPIAMLASSDQGKLASEFISFVLSEPGQRVLQAHGFLPVPVTAE